MIGKEAFSWGAGTVIGNASWSAWHSDFERLFLLCVWEVWKLLWTTLIPLCLALDVLSTAEREEKPAA